MTDELILEELTCLYICKNINRLMDKIFFSGVGNGDGSDLSVELRADGLLIYECRVADACNCEVTLYTINCFNFD